MARVKSHSINQSISLTPWEWYSFRAICGHISMFIFSFTQDGTFFAYLVTRLRRVTDLLGTKINGSLIAAPRKKNGSDLLKVVILPWSEPHADRVDAHFCVHFIFPSSLHVLHFWSRDECVKTREMVRWCVKRMGRVFVTGICCFLSDGMFRFDLRISHEINKQVWTPTSKTLLS